jgi:rubrerythrin
VVGLGGLGSLGLAGCGGAKRLRVSPQAGSVDADLLNHALAIEQRSIAAYTAAAPWLDAYGQKMAAQFLAQELLHAGELRSLVRQVGGQPHEPLGHYDFGRAREPKQLLALLHDLERQQIAAYLNAIPRISDPSLRQSLASVLANDAQHVTILRAQQGTVAMSAPFLSADE